MLENVVGAITDWPALLQGFVGSALFALVVYVGQKIFGPVSERIRSLSVSSRRALLNDKLMRLKAVTSTDVLTQTKYGTVLIYRAIRHLVKALIWLTLGLALGIVDSILGAVGFAGCLFYLFRALNVVSGTQNTPDVPQRIASLQAELAKLDGSKSASSDDAPG